MTGKSLKDLFKGYTIISINERNKNRGRVMQYIEPSEMHDKYDGNPNSHKYAYHRDKKQEKPEFFKPGFFNNAPVIVKRNQRFPTGHSGFLKHTVQANMVTNQKNNEENPIHGITLELCEVNVFAVNIILTRNGYKPPAEFKTIFHEKIFIYEMLFTIKTEQPL